MGINCGRLFHDPQARITFGLFAAETWHRNHFDDSMSTWIRAIRSCRGTGM